MSPSHLEYLCDKINSISMEIEKISNDKNPKKFSEKETDLKVYSLNLRNSANILKKHLQTIKNS